MAAPRYNKRMDRGRTALKKKKIQIEPLIVQVQAAPIRQVRLKVVIVQHRMVHRYLIPYLQSAIK